MSTDWVPWLILALFIIVIILSFVVQSRFKKTTMTYSAKASSSNKTGAEVAKKILEKNGITNVTIVRGNTMAYSDNYNPVNNVITLSASVYDSTSIAAISIASHEVGHAIQYATQSSLIKVRTTLIRPVMVVQKIGAMITQIGFLMAIILWGRNPLIYGVILGVGLVMTFFSMIFSFATLPVEYDASARAKRNLIELGIVSEKNSEEYKGVQKVLSSAAKTYLVGFLVSFTMFLIYLMMILSRRN